MLHLNQYLHAIITKLKEKNQILLIGIDGPTAAGKTTLADNLSKRLKKKFNVFTFRLDWTLKDRKFREDSLKNFKKFNKDFYFEAR
jgi:uridine kinase